ncbi:hypothetical protein [Treponema succinifaciens]|uniref:hypothetical protein n=1 Tax=Treponema succinifaciens TaxID=167 RepID=UPI003F816AEB
MIETNIQNQKELFLKLEFFLLSWAAAVQQRNRGQKLFKDNISDEKKNEFKKNLFEFTEEILKTYREKRVNSDAHHENLLKVHNFICEGKEFFAYGSYAFNFSTAQKYFNMMCKYYWCAGFIEEPPELPVDSINLSKIGKTYSWTKEIITKDDYEKVIEDFRTNESVSSESSLAVWELKKWNRRQFNGLIQ